MRRAYDAFLEHWPLCYVYVHKYATSAARRGASAAAVAAIYERGVACVPHCPALWAYYIAWRSSSRSSSSGGPGSGAGGACDDAAAVRALYERAVAAAGADFDAAELWLRYAEHERCVCGAAGRAVRVLARAAAVPLQQGAAVWARFAELVRGARVQDVLPAAAVDALGRAIAAAPSAEAAAALEDRARAAFVARVEAAHSRADARAAARAAFERVVLTRAYFHVKPVDAPVLDAWRRYLTDAEEQVAREGSPESSSSSSSSKDGKEKKEKEGAEEEEELAPGCGCTGEAWVRGLYERCLVPCAPYEEFWLRYAAHLDRAGDAAAAQRVLERAAAFVAHGGTGALTLQRALHAERAGDPARARTLFAALVAYASNNNSISSSNSVNNSGSNNNTDALCDAVVQAAAFECRAGCAAGARAVFERAIADAHGRGCAAGAAALAVRYALHLEARGDRAGCDGALAAALERQPGCAALCDAVLDVRCARARHAPHTAAEAATHAAFHRALTSNAAGAGAAPLLARWALFCRECAASVAVVRGIAEDAARAAHGLPLVWLAQPAHLARLGIAPAGPDRADDRADDRAAAPPPAKHARTEAAPDAPDPNVVSLATTTAVDID